MRTDAEIRRQRRLGLHLPTRQTRQHARRHLVAFGVEKAAPVQNLLDRKSERRHLGIMPARRAMTVETLYLAEPHLPAIPRHLAHILQVTRDKTTACRERQRTHRRRDPLLGFVALTGRNEELDGALDRDLFTAEPSRHFNERHRHVKRLLARLRQVLDLFDDRR